MPKKKSGSTARRVLDVIADILTVLALTVAGIGHLGPWFHVSDYRSYHSRHWGDRGGMDDQSAEAEEARRREIQTASRELTKAQAFYASRSGIALGTSAFFVFLSLVMAPGVALRKMLVVVLFISTMTAMVFQVLPFSPYNELAFDRSAYPALRIYEDWGLIMAMVATGIAGGFSLIRMTWTMTASKQSPISESERLESPPKLEENDKPIDIPVRSPE